MYVDAWYFVGSGGAGVGGCCGFDYLGILLFTFTSPRSAVRMAVAVQCVWCSVWLVLVGFVRAVSHGFYLSCCSSPAVKDRTLHGTMRLVGSVQHWELT